MKNTLRQSISILILLTFAGLWPRVALAEPSGLLEADMILMDDYGNILSHYTRETFQIQDGSFIYNDPPPVAGMSFATANILELITEKGSRYRVNYFYTNEGNGADEPVPDPFPMSLMPKKGAGIEERAVWVSWTDENMRELKESTSATFDYYWDAYEIPEPQEMPGYGYLKLATGWRSAEGEEVPHFVFVYKKGTPDEAWPSLLFGHLLEAGRIRTVKAEPQPDPTDPPAPGDPAEPAPPPDPVTSPVPEPVPEPDPGPGKDNGTQGEAEPQASDDDPPPVPVPATKPRPEDSPGPGTEPRPPETPRPTTVPARTAPAGPGSSAPGKEATRPQPEPAYEEPGDDQGDPQQGSKDSPGLSEGSVMTGALIFLGLGLAGAVFFRLNERQKRQ